MKWLVSAHQATRRFLIRSQQYHLHGGYCHRYIHSSNPNRSPNDNKLANGNKKVDLEIISRETIKPSTPTPRHLRTFNLSILDQYMFDVYSPLILFLSNSDEASVTDIVNKKSKHLKESLSKILTLFYPIAGKIKSNLQIECNDEGVYYIEARVNQTLQDFLCHPDDEKVKELFPESPCTAESSIGNYVVGVQVNIFLCGGIAISTSASHKIFDGHTYSLFMKAWAAAATSGLPETISPSFVASEIFPNNPRVEHGSFSSKTLASKVFCTKRFVFDSTALASLKAQSVANSSSTHGPTRMEATTALVWKAAAKAASRVRFFGPQSLHGLFVSVNLRKRASPPLPTDSIGNLVDGALALCYPERQMGLPTLMGELRDSIAKINSDYIESVKGEKGHKTFDGALRRLKKLHDMTGEGGYMFATSLLNSGMYDLDFGWAKPVWFYVTSSAPKNILTLNDMPTGGGVEAIVTLSQEEMKIFERDPELLSYAIVNPSPLRFLNC